MAEPGIHMAEPDIHISECLPAIPDIHSECLPADSHFITNLYTNSHTTISFPATYTLLKTLLACPPCPHRDGSNGGFPWPCLVCEKVFTCAFWDATAALLDYFADFFPSDCPSMQSLWFYLFDVWQSAVLWLDCDAAMARADAQHMSSAPDPSRDRILAVARRFQDEYDQAQLLVRSVLFGARRCPVRLGSEILHPAAPRFDEATESIFDPGPYLSGLKPWAQWLSNGSPGVATNRPFPSPSPSPPLPLAPITRHIPMPALAIVEKHSRRALRHAVHLARLSSRPTAEPGPPHPLLRAFAAHSLAFPRPHHSPVSYTSLTGRRVEYRLQNGAPPVLRYDGFGDEDLTAGEGMGYGVELGVWLLDECVGVCKGERGYRPGNGEEDEGRFDVWVVEESAEVVGRRMEWAEGWEDMFDDWDHGEAEAADEPWSEKSDE